VLIRACLGFAVRPNYFRGRWFENSKYFDLIEKRMQIIIEVLIFDESHIQSGSW